MRSCTRLSLARMKLAWERDRRWSMKTASPLDKGGQGRFRVWVADPETPPRRFATAVASRPLSLRGHPSDGGDFPREPRMPLCGTAEDENG
jgi:hypothetical protein